MSLAAIIAVDKKISATRDEIAEISSMDFIPQTVRMGMLAEANKRLAALEKERKNITYCREQVCLHFHGPDIEDGKISVRTLSKLLVKFQSLADSIAQVSLGEMATTKGKISQKILDAVNMNVVAFGCGSFEVHLENVAEINCVDAPIIENALMDMFSIFECGENTTLLTDQISPYGARFANRYKELLSDLLDNEMDLELRWTKSDADLRVFNITHKTTRNIIEFLETVNYVHDTPVQAKGKITMIDLRLFKFDMETDKYGVIKGKSRYETLLAAKNEMDSTVEVSLIKSECFTESNILARETWYLEKIL